MKVAFLGKNFRDTYSGGRIHAWMMAHAFAAREHNVHYYTNTKPVFDEELKDYSDSSNFKKIYNKFFLFFPLQKYDLIVIIPHLASKRSYLIDKWLFYPQLIFLKRISGCPVIYVDFESPNWINELVPGSRPEEVYKYSNNILSAVDVILSTTQEGMKYAAQYYTKYNSGLSFKQVYLSINSRIADRFVNSKKEKQVIYFGRFGEKHKNSSVLNDIINALPPYYTLLVIGNPEKLNADIYQALINQAKEKGIELVFKSGISEREKYEHLALSKLLIYSSSFEGYGLPPIEAQYVGTPVLCSDIPVLREVNKEAEFINFDDKEILTVKINSMLNAEYDKNKLKASVSAFAEFNNYVKNIKYLVDSI
ncbi:glycosyltransferase family 4 protein [Mucilaginibacter sp. KACC 22773]|uniref:glycosyltransferase family 4 protein n=1 Tax=Mucilaginibacter sp. KACC 22773 TaxID=3025671 RepID=UPI0023672A1C|nr:glycosyltransferase family 4 protein [Mucilaginibacter sp. KACC 22773]WDF79152.1 glycosyltransferase family 4 protein [Mucilaginibacter sp. KACC 22773]